MTVRAATSRCIFIVPLVAWIIMNCSGCTAQHRESSQTRPVVSTVFDPASDVCLGFNGGWVAWMRPEIDPTSIRNEVHHYRVRYYVQPIGGWGDPVMVFQGGGIPMHTAVLSDHTLFLYWYRELVWTEDTLDPKDDGDQASHRGGFGGAGGGFGAASSNRWPNPESPFDIVAIFPDGVIAVYPLGYSGGSVVSDVSPMCWIPIRDHQLDTSARFQLQILSSQSLNLNLKFIRHDDQITWIDPNQQVNYVSPKDDPHASIFVFDVPKLHIANVRISGVLENYTLSGFDGRWAFDGTLAMDTTTGSSSVIEQFDALGLIDGVAYGVRETDVEYELVAMPLSNPAQRDVVYRIRKSQIVKRPAAIDQVHVTDYAAVSRNLFILKDDHIVAWDGNKWSILKLSMEQFKRVGS